MLPYLQRILILILLFIDCSRALVSGTGLGTDERGDNRLKQQHGLHHPGVVFSARVVECQCSEYPDVASSDEYSHVASSSCREEGEVHFNFTVLGLIPSFVYEIGINWTLTSVDLTSVCHTWTSVVTTDTNAYTHREPLVQRNVNFHFGMMAWDAYKKGNDRFLIDLTVRDKYPGLTNEEALVGALIIDSSVRTVRLNCAVVQKSTSNQAATAQSFTLTAGSFAASSAAIPTNAGTLVEHGAAKQHGLDHPAVAINAPELECACDHSNFSSISSDRERDGDTSSRASACRAGDEASWVVSVHGLLPGFLYRLIFEWSLADDQRWEFNSVISTASSICQWRQPLRESRQNGHSSFDPNHSSRELWTRVSVWDMYPGSTGEEVLLGTRYTHSAVNRVRLNCADLDSGERTHIEGLPDIPHFQCRLHIICAENNENMSAAVSAPVCVRTIPAPTVQRDTVQKNRVQIALRILAPRHEISVTFNSFGHSNLIRMHVSIYMNLCNRCLCVLGFKMTCTFTLTYINAYTDFIILKTKHAQISHCCTRHLCV
jgi:hypothetical protein